MATKKKKTTEQNIKSAVSSGMQGISNEDDRARQFADQVARAVVSSVTGRKANTLDAGSARGGVFDNVVKANTLGESSGRMVERTDDYVRTDFSGASTDYRKLNKKNAKYQGLYDLVRQARQQTSENRRNRFMTGMEEMNKRREQEAMQSAFNRLMTDNTEARNNPIMQLGQAQNRPANTSVPISDKDRYEQNKQRIAQLTEELNDYHPFYDVQGQNTGMYVQRSTGRQVSPVEFKRLQSELEGLQAENRIYDRTQGVVDKYAPYQAASDFAEKSVSRTGPTMQGVDKLGAYLQAMKTNNGEQIGIAMTQIDAPGTVSAGNRINAYDNILREGEMNNWRFLEDGEIQTYYYLANTQGQQAADKYLNDMSAILGQRWVEQQQKDYESQSTLGKVLYNAATFGTNFSAGIAATMDTIKEAATGQEMNPYSYGRRNLNFTQAIRSQTAQDIDTATGGAGIGNFTFGDMYQALMSSVDSYLGASGMGRGFTSVMGLGAAQSKAQDLYNKGASEGQIVAGSILSGVAEAAFEYISLDKFLNTTDTRTMGQLVKQVLQQAGVEASEEMATEVANTFIDVLNRRTQSDWEQRVQSGGVKSAFLETLSEVIDAGAGGFISGGAMGGFGSLGNYAAYNAEMTDLGRRSYVNGAYDVALDYAQNQDNKVSDRTRQLMGYTQDEFRSANDIGKFVESVNEDINETQTKEAIRESLEQAGRNADEAVVNAVYDQMTNNADIVTGRGTESVSDVDIAGVEQAAEEKAQQERSKAVAQYDSTVRAENAQSAVDEAVKSVSDTGHTTLKNEAGESEDVDIARVEDIGADGMTLKLKDGRTVNSNDIAYGTEQEAILYESARNLGMTADIANNVINAYDAKMSTPIQFMYGMNEAINYGKLGVNQDVINSRGYYADLTPAQQRIGLNIGQSIAEADVKAAQEKMLKATMRTVAKDNGHIHFVTGTEFKDMTEIQKESIGAVARTVQNITHNEVYLYETVVGKDGQRHLAEDIKPGVKGMRKGDVVTANGFYDGETGNIYLDINAGNNGEGTILWTFSHEMTHWAKDLNRKAYNDLVSFLSTSYMEKSVDINTLARAKQAKLGLSFDAAMDEVIADSMERMFTDTNLEEKLYQFMNKNRTLFEKMRDAILRLFKRIQSLYSKVDPQTTEGELVHLMGDKLEKMSDLFASLLAGAGEVNTVFDMYDGIPVEEKFQARSPVERVNNLIAVHNLNESKLQQLLQYEGIPMPSIAITTDELGHENFGNISFLFRSDTIDPLKHGGMNRVYSADAWTPTFPSIEYEVNDKVSSKLTRLYYDVYNKFGEKIARPFYDASVTIENTLNRRGGISNIINLMKDDVGVKNFYLAATKGNPIQDITKTVTETMSDAERKNAEGMINIIGEEELKRVADMAKNDIKERNTWVREYVKDYVKDWLLSQNLDAEDVDYAVDNTSVFTLYNSYIRPAIRVLNGTDTVTKTEVDRVATNKAINEIVDQGAFEKWLENQFKGVEKSRGIYNGKDPFTRSGNRRSFSALHYEVNAENIVRAMLAQNNGNTQNTSGFLAGIKGVRSSAARQLESLDDIREASKKFNNTDSEAYQQMLDALSDRMYSVISDIKHDKDSFFETDSIGEIYIEAIEARKTTPNALKRFYKTYGYNLTDTQAQELSDVVKEADALPVNMFEAKPERVVGWDEVAAAFVPQTTDQSIKDKLSELGVPVTEYNEEVEGDRAAKLNQVADEQKIKFSERNQRYMDLAQKYDNGETSGKDLKEMQDLVETAAKEAGYDTKAYHGTQRFGFTQFDSRYSDDGLTFFATSSIPMAETYSSVYGTRNIQEPQLNRDQNIQELQKAYPNADVVRTDDADERTAAFFAQSLSHMRKATEEARNPNWKQNKESPKLPKKTRTAIAEILEKTINHYSSGQAMDSEALLPGSYTEEELRADSYAPVDYEAYGLDPKDSILPYVDIVNKNGYLTPAEFKKFANNWWVQKSFASNIEGEIKKAYRAMFLAEDVNNAISQNYTVYRTTQDGTATYHIYENSTAPKDSGNYSLFINTDGFLEVNGNGRNWSNISFRGSHYNTRGIAKIADREGYDGVVIHRIQDNGGYSKHGNTGGIADVYMVFDPNRLKSGDLVTYDSDGNIIPLSERFNRENNDIRYSERDSSGRTLSPAQQEYFKDSKVRDENGNLKVMYHGTSANDFTVFDMSRSGQNWRGDSRYGYGAYFTDKRADAKKWTRGNRIVEAYLNITNPFYANHEADSVIANEIDKYINQKLDAYNSEDVPLSKEQYEKNLQRIREMYMNGPAMFISHFKYDEHGNMTDGIRELLTSLGYDGIIADKEVVAFNPAQIKSVDNLNPTSDPDIRFSERNPEAVETLREANRALQRQVETLKGDIHNLIELLGVQAKTKSKGVISDSSLKAVAKKILSDNGVTARNQTDFLRALENVYDTMRTAKNISYEDIREVAQPAVDWIMKHLPGSGQLSEEAQQLFGYLKGKRFYVSPAVKAELASAYGDYNTFRKSLMGRVTLTTTDTNATSLDSVWGELSSQFPWLFNADTPDVDQWQTLYDTIQQMKNSGAEEEQAYFGNLMANDILSQIYNGYWDVSTLYNDDAKYKKEINELKYKHQQQIAKLKQYYNEKIADLRGKLKKEMQESMTAYRQRVSEREQKLRQDFRDRQQAQRQGRESTDFRRKIRRIADELKGRLLNPTERRYVPAALVNGVIDIANEIDTTWFDQNTASARKFRSGLEALSRLRDAYEELRTSQNYDWSSEYSEEFSEKIKWLAKAVGDTPVRNMTHDQLSDVYDILHDLQAMVQFATKQISDTENITNYNAGMEVLAEMEEINKLGLNKSQISAFFRNYLTNPLRAVNEMTGYNPDSRLGKLITGINEGIRKGDYWAMNTRKGIEELRDENVKAFNDATEKAYDFGLTDINGEPLKISKMQAMQLVMTWEREQANEARQHLQANGTVIADVDLLRKGRTAEARDKGQKIGPVTQQMIDTIRSKLSDWDMRFMQAARKVFDQSTQAINETTMQTKGRILATEKNYIPYEVNKDFVRTESENVKFDATIEGQGMLKAVKAYAPQPLLIRGLNAIVDKHINDVSKVYGLMVPVRNFNKVWNVIQTQKDGGRSVKDAVRSTWGQAGMDLIDKAVADVQSPRRTQTSKIVQKIKSGFVTSTLASNISVWMKQAASYPTAGSILSGSSLMKGLGRYAARKSSEVWAEIDKYTAQHYKRRQGLSSQELGDFNQSHGWTRKLSDKMGKLSPMNWIQAMDVATTAALWEATKAEVEKRGIKKDTEQYWQEVTKLYDEVIEKTQPMYDPLHRAEVTKNPALGTIIMFQTQPIQNSGILREATMEYKYAKKQYGAKSNQAKAAARNFRKAVLSQAASHLTFTAMTILANALMHKMNPYRRKDTGEVTKESILKQFAIMFGENYLNALIPVIGNYAISAAEKISGESKYDVFSDAVVDKLNSTLDAFNTLKTKPSLDNAINAFSDVAGYFGIPAKNVYNIVQGARYHIMDAIKGELLSFEAGYEVKAKQLGYRIYYALEADDETTAEANIARFKDEHPDSKWNSYVKTAITELFKAGKLTQAEAEERLVNFLDLDEFDLRKWRYQMENGSTEGYGKYNDFDTAVETGQNLKAVIKDLTDNGVEKSTLASHITSTFKPQYVAASNAERSRMKGYLLNAYVALGYDRDKKSKDIDNWLKD